MSENQRRSITGIGLTTNITLPVADGFIQVRDLREVAGIYGFVGVTTDGTFFVFETKYISRAAATDQFITKTVVETKYL